MLEWERQREALREATAPLLDEPVLTAAWGNRAGRWGDDGLRAVKAIRRWMSRGDAPADRLSAWCVLALTPTRLAVLNARYAKRLPPVEPRELLVALPLAAVTLDVHRHAVSSTLFNSTGSSESTRLRRATVAWTDEERPLVLDLHDDRLSRAVLAEIQSAIGAARTHSPER